MQQSLDCDSKDYISEMLLWLRWMGRAPNLKNS